MPLQSTYYIIQHIIEGIWKYIMRERDRNNGVYCSIAVWEAGRGNRRKYIKLQQLCPDVFTIRDHNIST